MSSELPARARSLALLVGRVAGWVFALPLVLLLVLYGALLLAPLPLAVVQAPVERLIRAALPEGAEVTFGDMALALDGDGTPVLRFSPLVYKDRATGATARVAGLGIGFSPLKALIGQPGVTATLVGPRLQINQDLFGPRLAALEIVAPALAGDATLVRVLEGATPFPRLGFSPRGIAITGEVTEATRVRSDNDWLIYNSESAEAAVAVVVEQMALGRFSRLLVRNGEVEVNDALFGTLRRFSAVSLDLAPGPQGGVDGHFSAEFEGQRLSGMFERKHDAQGDAHLFASLTNFHLTALLPAINDSESMLGLSGGTAASMDLTFAGATGKIKSGVFSVDLTGTELRIETARHPVVGQIVKVNWDPQSGVFVLAEAELALGRTSMRVAGRVGLGLDPRFGPTVTVAITARDLKIAPGDLPAPAGVFDEMRLEGWLAPLYGAVGIERALVRKGTAELNVHGRVDALRRGLGLALEVTGGGFSADDVKRLWPYFIASEARSWLVKNVTGGRLETAAMHYAFPIGTLDRRGEGVLPPGSVVIDAVATGVRVDALEGVAPVTIEGRTTFTLRNGEATIAGDGAVVATDDGKLVLSNGAVALGSEAPGERFFEVSGDVAGDVAAFVAIAKRFQPALVSSDDMPLDLEALSGALKLRAIATTTLDKQGGFKKQTFSATGSIADLASAKPIQGHRLAAGQLSFMATQAHYRIGGTAEVGGLAAEVLIEGEPRPDRPPSIGASATLAIADLEKFGLDASGFARGSAAVTLKIGDGGVEIVADLKNTAIDLADLGVGKAVGQPGVLKARLVQKGEVSEVEAIDLAFGDVRLKGQLSYHAKSGLKSAQFDHAALRAGDDARVSVVPHRGGYRITVRGEQMDLGPFLTRAFSLSGGSGGPRASGLAGPLTLDLQVTRALGLNQSVAYNANVALVLDGQEMDDVRVQAQLGDNRSVSAVSNPGDGGPTLSVAFNDLGAVLRFVGVYKQLRGGEGSLVLRQNRLTKLDLGTLTLKDFAIVDEKNVVDIVGRHADSRKRLAGAGGVSFASAQAEFVRRTDRIQILNVVATGDAVGGSAEGFIYTDKKEYDIVGTYVPLFGINNVFGRLLGGGKTGGLLGVTFAMRGPLDKPKFSINPLSLLAPGAFRNLFEFRAREQPRAEP